MNVKVTTVKKRNAHFCYFPGAKQTLTGPMVTLLTTFMQNDLISPLNRVEPVLCSQQNDALLLPFWAPFLFTMSV